MARLEFMRSVSFTDLLNTGTWSLFQPRFLNGVAPCMDACPASIDMPRIYDLLRRGEIKEAALLLLKFNPFPFITGEICPQYCASPCNRRELDHPVEIRKMERWLGEEILDRDIVSKPSPTLGKRVLIVGSGPAGLSAAHYLATEGVRVTVREREATPGGMLAWGIPAFRFNREMLQHALERLYALGVKIETGSPITPEALEEEGKGFDSVVVATGLPRARCLPQARPGKRVLYGIEVLKRFNLHGELPKGRNLLVIGGGNVAVDVARLFARKGCSVTMACVEQREDMPAIEEEVHEALNEGVEIACSVGLREAREEEGQVNVTLQGVEVVDASTPMKRVRFTGQPHPGIFDLVVLAVGQEEEEGWKDGPWITSGDVKTGPSSVAAAIASGREAARRVLAGLTGRRYLHAREDEWKRETNELVTFQDLAPYNLSLFNGSDEIPPGVPSEVKECVSCGYCNGCGTCWLFCPDAAIRLEQPPVLDAQHCKGCGICATECPRGVVFMRKREGLGQD